MLLQFAAGVTGGWVGQNSLSERKKSKAMYMLKKVPRIDRQLEAVLAIFRPRSCVLCINFQT